MNETQKNKVQRFLADEVMAETIKSVLENECLKTSKDRDVQNLAARFLAVEIINGAWQELSKYRLANENEVKSTATPHV